VLLNLGVRRLADQIVGFMAKLVAAGAESALLPRGEDGLAAAAAGTGALAAATTVQDVQIMRDAVDEARRALARREVPVGCIVVDDTGKVVCKKRNRPNETYNATAHAEMLAVDEMVRSSSTRQAARELFGRCTLYVTVEPCVMCAAALTRVGLKRVVFGASNDKFGGCGTAVDVVSGRHCPGSSRHHAVECTGGLLQDEAVQLLRQFYARGNVRAPRPQRPVPPEWRSASMARAPPRYGGRPPKRAREGTSEAEDSPPAETAAPVPEGTAPEELQKQVCT